MREILFRAKRKDNGEWTEGYVFELQPGQYMICDRIQYDRPSTLPVWEFFRYCSHEIDPETLCQYTGLTDKNGNRIWENNIVRIKNSMDEGIGNIEFYGGMWYVDGEPSNSLYDIVEYDDGELEVIGNIFDTPELLKGGLTCRN